MIPKSIRLILFVNGNSANQMSGSYYSNFSITLEKIKHQHRDRSIWHMWRGSHRHWNVFGSFECIFWPMLSKENLQNGRCTKMSIRSSLLVPHTHFCAKVERAFPRWLTDMSMSSFISQSDWVQLFLHSWLSVQNLLIFHHRCNCKVTTANFFPAACLTQITLKMKVWKSVGWFIETKCR